MKPTLSYLKTLLLLVILCPVLNVSADDYTLTDDDVVVINGVLISSTLSVFSVPSALIIPDVLDGQAITAIEDADDEEGIFKDKNIQSLVLPEGLEFIGCNEFSGNVIDYLALPSHLVEIADEAFVGSDIRVLNLEACTALEIIGNEAFSDNTIINLDLSSCYSLKSIGDKAFYLCRIETLNTENCTSLTTIGDEAFYNNYTLNSIDLSHCSALQTIGEYAFYYCGTESLDITGCTSLTTIGDYAFQVNVFHSSGINELDLSYCTSLEYIGKSAFLGAFLKGMTLPSRTDANFLGWFSVSDSYYSPDYEYYNGGDVVSDFSLAYKINRLYTLQDADVNVVDGMITMCYLSEFIPSVIIPEQLDGQQVIGIADHNSGAFYLAEFKEITFPEGFEYIGEGAFRHCDLETITLPSTLSSIGRRAFYDNSNLTDVDFSACTSLVSIADYAFYACPFTDSLIFESCISLEHLGALAFDANNLSCLDLRANTSLVFVGDDMCYSSSPTVMYLPFPEGDPSTLWGDNAGEEFKGEEPITNFSTPYFLPYELTDDDVEVVDGYITSCSYNFSSLFIKIPEVLDNQTIIGIEDGISQSGIFKDKGIRQISLPSTLEVIGDYEFYENNLDILSLPKNLKSIGRYSFYSCDIDSLDLSKSTSLTDIGNAAFHYNPITNLDFSNCTSLTSIGDSAFYYNQIKILDFSNSPSLSAIGNYAFRFNKIWKLEFEGCSSLRSIGESAFSGGYDSGVDTILPVDFRSCKSLRYIGGNSFNYSESSGIWLPSIDDPDFLGWKNIGYNYMLEDGAFIEYLSIAFTAVLPYTLTDEDVEVVDGVIVSTSYDFLSKYIVIPSILDGQTIIGIDDGQDDTGVFAQKQLDQITFPNTLQYIGKYEFYENNINNLSFAKCPSLSHIDDYAFYSNGLRSLDLSACESLVTIADFAFAYNSIDSIDLSSCVALKSIGNGAFYYATSTSSVKLENCTSLTTIGESAFAYSKMESMNLQGCPSLHYIGEGAFYSSYINTLVLPTLVDVNFTGWQDVEGDLWQNGDSVVYDNSYYAVKIPYTLTDDDVTVEDGVVVSCSYDFTSKFITMPDVLDGDTIVGIGNAVNGTPFFYNQGIIEMNFPSSLVEIGYIAFYGNDICKLDLSSIPNLEVIAAGAFFNNAIHYLDFSATPSIKKIGEWAFISNLVDSISFFGCDALIEIGDDAFSSNSITEVNLWDCTALYYIGDDAFSYNRVSSFALPLPNYPGFETWVDSYPGKNYPAGVSVSTDDSYKAVIPDLYSVSFKICFEDDTRVPDVVVSLEGYGDLLTSSSGLVSYMYVEPATNLKYTITTPSGIVVSDFVDVYDKNVSLTITLEPTVVKSVVPKSVAIYPNPAYDNVTIKAVSGDLIQIYSIMGQLLYQTEMDSDSKEIDISVYPSGTYIIKVGESVQKLMKR